MLMTDRSTAPAVNLYKLGLSLLIGLSCLFAVSGCQLIGGMAESGERYKEIEVKAQYYGLEGKTVAVLIDAPYEILFEYPTLVTEMTDILNLRLASKCPGTQVLTTRDVLKYQTENVYWPSMDYSELINDLDVQRLVIIDLIEYRLHEPGNGYIWKGASVGDVMVFEADGIDPSNPAYMERVIAKFPKVSGIGIETEDQATIEQGLRIDFVQRVSWLFYNHIRTAEDIKKDTRP